MEKLRSVTSSFLWLLLLVAWLGCGKSEYDRRLETRIQQLRTVASEAETTAEDAAPSPRPQDEASPDDEDLDADEEQDEVDPDDEEALDEAAAEEEPEEE